MVGDADTSSSGPVLLVVESYDCGERPRQNPKCDEHGAVVAPSLDCTIGKETNGSGADEQPDQLRHRR